MYDKALHKDGVREMFDKVAGSDDEIDIFEFYGLHIVTECCAVIARSSDNLTVAAFCRMDYGSVWLIK